MLNSIITYYLLIKWLSSQLSFHQNTVFFFFLKQWKPWPEPKKCNDSQWYIFLTLFPVVWNHFPAMKSYLFTRIAKLHRDLFLLNERKKGINASEVIGWKDCYLERNPSAACWQVTDIIHKGEGKALTKKIPIDTIGIKEKMLHFSNAILNVFPSVPPLKGKSHSVKFFEDQSKLAEVLISDGKCPGLSIELILTRTLELLTSVLHSWFRSHDFCWKHSSTWAKLDKRS